METKEEYKKQSTLTELDVPQASIPSNKKEDVLDLSEFIKMAWKDRKIVWVTALICLLTGIFIAFASPIEYKSEVLLLPQSSSEKNRGLGFLQQFGISVGGAETADMSSISTTLYPEVIQSTPYLLHLAHQDVTLSSSDTTINLISYFNDVVKPPFINDVKKYTIGLPKLILKIPINIIDSFKSEKIPTPSPQTFEDSTSNSFSSDSLNAVASFDIFQITPREAATINQLKERIQVEVRATGIVSLSAKMPDPYAAATLTSISVKYLTDYVVQYRTEKLKQNLAFIEQQYEESKKNFVSAQRKLAIFRDRNRNIVNDQARTELEQLQAEYDLYFGIYRSFAQQKEQAKIKLQEETPVFKELEPVKVPSSKSEPNTELIIIGSLFFGIFLGLGILVVKIFWKSLMQTIHF